MKCPIRFSEKNKKNIINLSSAEFYHSALSVKYFNRKYLNSVGLTEQFDQGLHQQHLTCTLVIITLDKFSRQQTDNVFIFLRI